VKNKFTQRKDNEWFVVGDNTMLKCCDCGLVHKIKFRVKDNLLWMKAKRIDKKKESEL